MSPKRGTEHPNLDAKDAINAVLDAERETMDAIAACDSRARDIIEAARETARRIARRTDLRIAAVHAHDQTELSPAPHAANSTNLTTSHFDASQSDALREAADRVAQVLTTTGSDDRKA